MEIKNLIIPTAISQPGMSVADVLRECVQADVPGIPFQDESGQIIGKSSIRHILKETCIPDFLVKHSHLLGDKLSNINISDQYIQQVLSQKVDAFVLNTIALASSNTPVAKILAMMERYRTTYIFIVDDGMYKGVISIMGISKLLLEKELK